MNEDVKAYYANVLDAQTLLAVIGMLSYYDSCKGAKSVEFNGSMRAKISRIRTGKAKKVAIAKALNALGFNPYK